MDWTLAVDIYCERTSAAFWAEPVNAISNAAFPMAALWAAIEARRRAVATPVLWLLIVMAALIGVGSSLFHTFANRWSEYADTIPIWSFVALFVFTAIHQIGGVRPGRLMAIALGVGAVLTVVYLAADEGVGVVESADPLNGSGQYAPALMALLIFAEGSVRRRHPMRYWIVGAALAFCASLMFRTVDMAVCPQFPLGSHFIWHLLNGLMVGLLLQVLLRSPPQILAKAAA
ncbi:MAG: ceramidase domain-containing protein [Paracoccaceae bacterium]